MKPYISYFERKDIYYGDKEYYLDIQATSDRPSNYHVPVIHQGKFVKWVVDKTQKDELIAEIKKKVKENTNNNIEQKKWMSEEDLKSFETDEMKLQFHQIEDAVSFMKKLPDKSMEELIKILQNAEQHNLNMEEEENESS